MEIEEYYAILDTSNRRIQENAYATERFLLKKIDWRDRLICISGSRGCGKTTMLLQHIRSEFENDPEKEGSLKYQYMIDRLNALYPLDETHGILSFSDIKEGCNQVFQEFRVGTL